MSPTRLSRVLKTLREEKGLTQVDLAKRAKVTQSYVAMLEGGNKANPSLAILQRLAKALGVPAAKLLE
jgi:XRE family transcriptional regulator, regulator of sulfur utilization